MKGHYTININSSKKEMNIKIVGNFTSEQAQQYINEYTSKVNTINASDYTLFLDCKDLNVITQELTASLEACYKLYNASGFNKTIIEIKKSAILKMQLTRIARGVGFNPEFLEVA